MNGWLVSLILLPVALAETSEVAPWLARRCIEWGARRLGDEITRERYSEEWRADLDRVPGKVTKLGYAATVVTLAVPRLRWRVWRSEREVPGMRAAAARAITALGTADGIDAVANLIASGVVCSLGFQQVAVNLVKDNGDLCCVAAMGPQEMRDALLGGTCKRAVIDRLLASGTVWGSLRFVRALTVTPGSDDIHVFSSEKTATGDSALDAWDPEDAFLVPLHTPTGELIGVLSLDAPVNGRIPGHAQRALVETYAAHAATRLLDAYKQISASQGPLNVR